MTRVSTSNYAGTATTTFWWATAGTDRFSRIYDLYYLAQAVENHDHSAGKGLAVNRVASNAIATANIQDGAVTTAKINDLGVTDAKLADLSITSGKLAANAVTTAKITDLNVTTAKINDLAVTTAKINDLAVTTGKINDLAVTTGKINDLAVTGAKIANDTITATQIAADAIGSSELANNAVDTAAIADSAVTTAKIADANVTAGKLAAESVTEAKLDALDTPADNEVLTYDNTSGRLKWQDANTLVTGGATVPSGLIAAFATAAAIASGWARYTAADGRLLVGAGTAGSPTMSNPATFLENTNYGSDWQHTHSQTAHTHSGADLSLANNTAASTNSTNSLQSGGGTATRPQDHTHGPGSMDIAGNTGNGGADGSTTTGGSAWVIPSRAVVWAQKS